MTKNTSDMALVYVRVSTKDQTDTGHSLEDQTRDLTEQANRAGYSNVFVMVDESKSGKKMSNRHALNEALYLLDHGSAAALFVRDIDRLSRSVIDTAKILERSRRNGWRLVVTGLGGIDTSTPEGELLVGIMSAAARFESQMTSQRVKRQHEARRQRGVRWSIDEGCKPLVADEVRARIVAMRAEGQSLRKIADTLTETNVPTAKGGTTWHASTVKHLLDSPTTQALVNA
jgi:DNA invertase Pin-like site-specific DNA recombinase